MKQINHQHSIVAAEAIKATTKLFHRIITIRLISSVIHLIAMMILLSTWSVNLYFDKYFFNIDQTYTVLYAFSICMIIATHWVIRYEGHKAYQNAMSGLATMIDGFTENSSKVDEGNDDDDDENYPSDIHGFQQRGEVTT